MEGSMIDVFLCADRRIIKAGNNRFGSKGCIKCDECRRRKTKVASVGNSVYFSVYMTRTSHTSRVVIVKNVVQDVGNSFRRTLRGRLRPSIRRRLPPPNLPPPLRGLTPAVSISNLVRT